MVSEIDRKQHRRRRQKRVRRKVWGVPERPRLCVCKTLRHIHAQVIDDSQGRTLVSASTTEPEIARGLKGTGNAAAAEALGTVIAQRALERGVKAVVFDRAGHLYHGKVKALADAAREAGLEF